MLCFWINSFIHTLVGPIHFVSLIARFGTIIISFPSFLAQRSAGYILEATGNYLTLHGVQNELEKLETTCQSYIYDHTVSGGTRFLFLNQSSQEQRVTFKKLKKDFAVNIAEMDFLHSGEDLAARKFQNAISSQLQVYNREYLSYVHGADNLIVKAEFGSIYVENASPLFGDNVESVERTLRQTADPKNQSPQARRNTLLMRHKFMSLAERAEARSIAFPESILLSSSESYTLGIKAGKNHTLTVIYDKNLELCDVEIPSINWVVADVKAPRSRNSKSRDIDMRITICSERKLDEEEEKQEIMASASCSRFKSAIRKSANGDTRLELAHELQKKVIFVRHEKTSTYSVPDNNSSFIQVKEVEKYDAKGQRFLNNPKTFIEEQIRGSFNGKNENEAMNVAKEVWAAAKKLRQYISS